MTVFWAGRKPVFSSVLPRHDRKKGDALGGRTRSFQNPVRGGGSRQRRQASSAVFQAGRSGLSPQAARERQWSGLHPDFQDFMNNGEPVFPPTKDAESQIALATCKA